MKFFLTAKHWQIFLILLMGLILNNFTVENQPLLTIILSVIGHLIIFCWPLILGIELYQYLPGRIEMSRTYFVINALIFLLTYTAIIIISEGEGMSFNGLEALPFMYVFFAFLHYMTFPARVLKSIKTGKRASFADYIGYVALIIFWPIGIWLLQPRINRYAPSQARLA
jgi:hypothetical protein